jgi:exosome complex component RRP40
MPQQQQQQQQQQLSSLITVLPGDDVTRYIDSSSSTKFNLGLGLIQSETSNRITATLAGRLHFKHHTWYVLANTKRYIPKLDDRVLGIVEDRVGQEHGGDVYRINIGGPHPAMLSSLRFEGATKRNRPMLTPGTLVYARIIMDDGFLTDPTLSCMLGPQDAGVPRKDWMTDEAVYGQLKGGTVVKISLGLARELLQPDNVVLEELSTLPFEVAIGVNGFLWIHSKRAEYTIMIQNAILNSEVLTEQQTRGMVRKLIKTVQQQLEDQDSSADDDADDDQEQDDTMED